MTERTSPILSKSYSEQIQRVAIVDNVYGIGKGVDVSGVAISIDYPHHEIHSGNHFYICGFETEATDGEINFAVTTPDTTKELHMLFFTEGTARTEFYVYEGAAVTGGTATTSLNNNRNSTNVSVATIVKDPTINTAGTLIFSQSKGLEGATPSKADNEGLIKRENEIILKRNTTYVFKIISKADDNIISYCGEWYEETL